MFISSIIILSQLVGQLSSTFHKFVVLCIKLLISCDTPIHCHACEKTGLCKIPIRKVSSAFIKLLFFQSIILFSRNDQFRIKLIGCSFFKKYVFQKDCAKSVKILPPRLLFVPWPYFHAWYPYVPWYSSLEPWR